MRAVVGKVGFWSGMAAFAATLAYDIVQVGQLSGLLRFPVDEILIYGAALCIAIPFVLEMLALHYLTAADRQYWTHAALLLAVMYAVFVIANYVVQLATVIPAKLHGEADAVRLLEQTPHSLFWNFDAIGYILMGIATLIAIPALGRSGLEAWVRRAFIANALVTPLIAVVYFRPQYSPQLLLLGSPWGITAPLSMILLAFLLRERSATR